MAASAFDRKLNAALLSALTEAGDRERAEGQQRYMKSALPYLGVRVPDTRRIAGTVFRSTTFKNADQWQRSALFLWRQAQFREQRYGAMELLRAPAYRSWLTAETLPVLDEMVVTGAWWDYVDQLATQHFWNLLATYRTTLAPLLRRWSTDDDCWRRRVSILVQLKAKADTDERLLFDCIEPSVEADEFFLRKAIGWALREYSKTAPQRVNRYVKDNIKRLSPLSQREALKHINAGRRPRRQSTRTK